MKETFIVSSVEKGSKWHELSGTHIHKVADSELLKEISYKPYLIGNLTKQNSHHNSQLDFSSEVFEK